MDRLWNNMNPSVFNSIPFSILRNLNPQQIQMTANSLWENANQYIVNNMPFSQNFVRESVTLLADMSPENRLFLEKEAKDELSLILNEKKCKVNLNLGQNYTSTIDSQISITGAPDGVQEAYLAIRQLVPITVWFDLKLNASKPSIVLDPNAQPMFDIQKKYELSICVIPIQSPVIQPMPTSHISIYVRTNRRNEDKLKTGIEELTLFIESNNFGTIYPSIQTKIDVPSNQPTIIGRTFSVLDPIAAKTSTQISVQKSASNLMSNVSIIGGSYSSISSARTEISDRFVVELDFEINEYQSKILDNYSRQLERMGEEFATHILMKPSVNPIKKTMIIRGSDKEVCKLFKVRQHIIALIQNPPTTIQTSCRTNLLTQ